VRYEELEDEDDVKLWMIRTQAHRRNLSTELLLHYEMVGLEIEKKKAQERIESGGYECKGSVKHPRSNSTYGSLQNLNKEGKALEQVAKNAGVGYEKAYRYKHILDAGREKEVLEDGRSINKVFKDLRKEGKTQYAPVEFPRDNYRIVYADLYRPGDSILGWPFQEPLSQGGTAISAGSCSAWTVSSGPFF